MTQPGKTYFGEKKKVKRVSSGQERGHQMRCGVGLEQ